MRGIDFVVDDKGQKKAAIVDLNKYGEAFADFMDGLVATSRRREPSVSLAALKNKAKK